MLRLRDGLRGHALSIALGGPFPHLLKVLISRDKAESSERNRNSVLCADGIGCSETDEGRGGFSALQGRRML